jgi:hypothetical protein
MIAAPAPPTKSVAQRAPQPNLQYVPWRLRALMTGLLGTAYRTRPATTCRDWPATDSSPGSRANHNLYALTGDGLRFAVFYTKVHDRVLRPLMAGDQPQAPPPLRDALRVIDGEVTRRLAAARLPAAA